MRGETESVPKKTATASSYSITMRLHTTVDHGVVGEVATAIATAVCPAARRSLATSPAAEPA